MFVTGDFATEVTEENKDGQMMKDLQREGDSLTMTQDM